MFIRRAVVNRALTTLRDNPAWIDAEMIVRKNVYCKHYGVGGMLYRNLIAAQFDLVIENKVIDTHTGELMPSYDFDFLVMGKVRRQWLPNPDWHWKGSKPTQHYNSGTGGSLRKKPVKYSATAIHGPTGIKIDMVSILDIMEQQGSKRKEVATYFNAVPLDIQRIAYDFKADRLWGEAIEAIYARMVRVNNPKAFDIYVNPINIDEYGLEKTQSLPGKFTFTEINTLRTTCNCDITLLWNRGCQCGALIRSS